MLWRGQFIPLDLKPRLLGRLFVLCFFHFCVRLVYEPCKSGRNAARIACSEAKILFNTKQLCFPRIKGELQLVFQDFVFFLPAVEHIEYIPRFQILEMQSNLDRTVRIIQENCKQSFSGLIGWQHYFRWNRCHNFNRRVARFYPIWIKSGWSIIAQPVFCFKCLEWTDKIFLWDVIFRMWIEIVEQTISYKMFDRTVFCAVFGIPGFQAYWL